MTVPRRHFATPGRPFPTPRLWFSAEFRAQCHAHIEAHAAMTPDARIDDLLDHRNRSVREGRDVDIWDDSILLETLGVDGALTWWREHGRIAP